MAARSVQISLDQDLLEAIDRRPETKRDGRSAVIKRALRLYLEQAQRESIDDSYARAYGSIVILTGRTEPGASVEVNGEDALVNADGGFNKTVQLAAEGWSFIEIRARDAWGNETVRKQRVYVEGL